MIKDSIDEAVDRFDARDGFRVVELIRGSWHWLYMAMYADGEMVDIPIWHTDGTKAIPLWKAHNPTPEELGKACRIKLFAEAICRFLNSGGNWDEMSNLLSSCRVASGSTVTSFDQFGFKLLDSYINSDGDNEHVFAAAGERRVIRWVENSFVESLSDYMLKQDWDRMESVESEVASE